MYNLINNWLNLEFYSTIGEPWDFISDKGENILEGKIVDILEKKMKYIYYVKLVHSIIKEK